MVDIREHQDVIDILNAILNNKGIAEIKMERGETPVIVEIKRTLRTQKK